ncbi:hypothetical protein [Haloquadratum walsbyi]|jgi:hypothetical protein|uniref:DUF7322 domain-containing protein n=1 Tax=Haloquadratum walsbyi J07HQW2 TaxID=1238425 RepID=U1NIK6_9EURY|nr:hypothetical protein [Haloquadratum walsbyi]ERG96748.1 MAG: hypothetical protein J07HQW2_03231 [Haloquadratum walsbyi J07HQW2]
MPFDDNNWPDEPTEYDPESRWGDPERDLVSIPSVDIPTTKDVGEESGLKAFEGTISGKQARFFMLAIVFGNIAVGGIGIGILLIGFRGQWNWGGGSIALGSIALYRTYRLTTQYYQHISGPNDDSHEPNATTSQSVSTAGEDALRVGDEDNDDNVSS